MNMRVSRFANAGHSIAWALLVFGLGCGASTQPTRTEPSATLSTAGSVSGEEHGEMSQAGLVAAEREAYERARPVLVKYRARCHSSGGAKPWLPQPPGLAVVVSESRCVCRRRITSDEAKA